MLGFGVLMAMKRQMNWGEQEVGASTWLLDPSRV